MVASNLGRYSGEACSTSLARIFWLTVMNSVNPTAWPNLTFPGLELLLLDKLVQDRKDDQSPYKSAFYLRDQTGQGYLVRVHDPPSGNMVFWRVLLIPHLGFRLGAQLVGN